jgi:hypothetical protein
MKGVAYSRDIDHVWRRPMASDESGPDYAFAWKPHVAVIIIGHNDFRA